MSGAQLIALAEQHGAVTLLPFTDVSGTTATDEGRFPDGATYGNAVILGRTPPNGFAGAVDLPGNAGGSVVNTKSIIRDNGNWWTPFTLELVAIIDGPGSVGDTTYATLSANDSAYRFLVHATTGAVIIQGAHGNTTAAAGAVPVGSWFHFVWLSYGYGHTHKVYVNGIQVTLGGVTTNGMLSAVQNLLGSFGGAAYFLNGGLAFAASYGTLLTPAKIAEHFAVTGL